MSFSTSHFHHFSFIMDVKVSSLLLLFSLCSASLCSAEHVNLVVRGVTAIANTDENFICATLDWWPSSKCDYNDCPWGKAGIFNLVFFFKFNVSVFSLTNNNSLLFIYLFFSTFVCRTCITKSYQMLLKVFLSFFFFS